MPKPRHPRRTRPLRDELLNVPNILTYLRIVVVPFLVIVLYDCRVGADATAADMPSRAASFWATILFAVAAITDFLDGWVARNYNLSTMVGRFLDPLADKIMVTTTLVMLVHLQRVPAWFVVLLIVRELSITSLRSIASSEGLEIQVAQSGKWKTAFQICGLIGLLVYYEYPVTFGFADLTVHFGRVGLWLLGLSLVFSIFSAGQYFHRFAVAAAAADEAAFRERRETPRPPKRMRIRRPRRGATVD